MIQCIDRVIPLHKYNKIMQVPQRILRSKKCQKKGIGNGWEMGAASCPHIADEGWAGFRETIERERRRERERERVQRLSQSSHSTGRGEGETGVYVPAFHICYSFVPSWEENSRKRSGCGRR